MLIEIAKQQLRKAGWYEGRKIDLTKYEEEYAKLGCELFPAASKFLEEYGDLDIQDKYILPVTDKNGNPTTSINRSLINVAIVAVIEIGNWKKWFISCLVKKY